MKCVVCDLVEAGQGQERKTLVAETMGNLVLHGLHVGILLAGELVSQGMPPMVVARLCERATSLCDAHRSAFLFTSETVGPDAERMRMLLRANVRDSVVFVELDPDDERVGQILDLAAKRKEETH
jgi:hypothetical protein